LIAQNILLPISAIRGGSNGGLLVGATMTQRPELMKVALPAVGVMDMLRYHTLRRCRLGIRLWNAQDSEEMFELKAFSCTQCKSGNSLSSYYGYHGDHDDRVVPAHSFKFAAELQEKQTGNDQC
jgi:prolyl oligopeptidase